MQISSSKMILRREDGFLPYVHLHDDNMKNQRFDRIENRNRDSNKETTLSKDNQPSIEMKFIKREREKETSLPSAKIPAHYSMTSSSPRIEPAPKTRQEIEAGAFSAGAVKSS